MLEAYHQQPGEPLGEILALDGKALKCTRGGQIKRRASMWSVSTTGKTQQVLVQEVVATTENLYWQRTQALARVPVIRQNHVSETRC